MSSILKHIPAAAVRNRGSAGRMKMVKKVDQPRVGVGVYILKHVEEKDADYAVSKV